MASSNKIKGFNTEIDDFIDSLSDGKKHTKLITERIMLKGIYPYIQIRDLIINEENVEKPSFVSINSIHRYDKSLRNALFEFIALIEEKLRAVLYNHLDNKKRDLVYKRDKTKNFRTLIDDLYNNNLVDEIKRAKLVRIVDLRNRVCHNWSLLINEENKIDKEKNEEIILLTEFLDEDTKNKYISVINNQINMKKLKRENIDVFVPEFIRVNINSKLNINFYESNFLELPTTKEFDDFFENQSWYIFHSNKNRNKLYQLYAINWFLKGNLSKYQDLLYSFDKNSFTEMKKPIRANAHELYHFFNILNVFLQDRNKTMQDIEFIRFFDKPNFLIKFKDGEYVGVELNNITKSFIECLTKCYEYDKEENPKTPSFTPRKKFLEYKNNIKKSKEEYIKKIKDEYSSGKVDIVRFWYEWDGKNPLTENEIKIVNQLFNKNGVDVKKFYYKNMKTNK